MERNVLLLSESGTVEHQWATHLGHRCKLRRVDSHDWPHAIRGCHAVVLDLQALAFRDDEDESLTVLALARALGKAVAAHSTAPGARIPALLEDACGNRLVRQEAELQSVTAALRRQLNADLAERLELITLSPLGDELLCLFADGAAMLLARPYADDDDGSEVVAIELDLQAQRARLGLASGRNMTLDAVRHRRSGPSPRVRPQSPARDDEKGFDDASGMIELGSTEHVRLDSVQLGAKLRALRLQTGLTQAELAKRTGIHRPNIARVEAGRHTPSLDTLERLASAMGVSSAKVLQSN